LETACSPSLIYDSATSGGHPPAERIRSGQFMSMRERVAALGWLFGGAAAMAITAIWVLAAQPGQVSAFVLVPFMWSVALLAGFVHHWRLARKPLLGEQPGALLSS
jgi:hypothetical protein